MSTSNFQKIALAGGTLMVAALGVIGAGTPAMASVAGTAAAPAGVSSQTTYLGYYINAGGGTLTATFTPAPGSNETPYTSTENFKIVQDANQDSRIQNGVMTVDTNLNISNNTFPTAHANVAGSPAQYQFSGANDGLATSGTLTQTHDLNYNGDLIYTGEYSDGSTVTFDYHFTLLQMQPIMPY